MPAAGKTLLRFHFVLAVVCVGLTFATLAPTIALAQVVLPAPGRTSTDARTLEADERDASAVPPQRMERMLTRLSAESPQLGLLNLQEYVVVVGEAPEVSLFGTDADLSGVGYGLPSHAEILGVTRPSDFSQAAGSDALGIATASMFTALVPAAIKAVQGWFASDDGQPDRPRYAGYTGRLHIDPGQAESSTDPSAVPFYRTEGQPVFLSVRFSHDVSYGIRIVVDDQELGVFNEDAVDVPVPDALLASALPGDVHLLEVSPSSRSPLSKRVEVDVVVVVYAADH